jgi:glycosyltransferase involved in cell wall biosynthesis
VIDSLGAGGAERVVATLAREQARRHVVAVAYLLEEHDLASELRASGIEVYPLGVDGWRQVGLGALRLHRLTRRFGTQLLHAHLALATMVAALTPGPAAQRVVSFHNLGVAGGSVGGLKTRALRSAFSALVPRRFAHVTAVSCAAARAYEQELGLSHTPRVMPNPVDVAQLEARAATSAEVARQQLGLPQERAVVVSVAKLTWEKNHRTLLEALALIPRAERPFVALVGDGPLSGELRALCSRLGLDDCVRWCGARPGEEIPAWLRASTVFVLPSVSEGQPVSLLEAMALNVPVIATAVGGIPELLTNERGWLVQPKEAAGLATALRDALGSSTERATRALAARHLIEEEYSVPVVARKWEELLTP